MTALAKHPDRNGNMVTAVLEVTRGVYTYRLDFLVDKKGTGHNPYYRRYRQFLYSKIPVNPHHIALMGVEINEASSRVLLDRLHKNMH